MAENYIKRLERELAEARALLKAANDKVVEMESYYTSPKFHEHDFAYVRTDVLPRLREVRMATLQ